MKVLTRDIAIEIDQSCPAKQFSAMAQEFMSDLRHVIGGDYFKGSRDTVITRFIPHGGDVGDEYVFSTSFTDPSRIWSFIANEWFETTLVTAQKLSRDGTISLLYKIQNQEVPHKAVKLLINCGPHCLHGLIITFTPTAIRNSKMLGVTQPEVR